MTERMEAIAAWHLDTKRPKQRPELSLEQQVLIPRRSIASGEEQPTLVRMPRLPDRPQVPTSSLTARAVRMSPRMVYFCEVICTRCSIRDT